MVICDRYIWDTLIDFNIMFPHIDIKKWMLWKILVWFTPIPDKSILLTIPLSLSEERCLKKFDPFPDSPEVRETRYQLYVSLSKKNKWKIIDSSSSRDDVFQAIMNT